MDKSPTRRRPSWLRNALAGLIAAGAAVCAQADEVLAAVAANFAGPAAQIAQEHAVAGNLVGSWADLWELMELHGRGRLRLVTETHPLEAVNDVLERLRLDTLLGRRAAAMRGVRGHPSLAEGRLDLETLSSPQGFTTRHLRDGSQQTYQLAFLLADHLIRREGFERVVEYFRLFGERADRHANFTAAFGQSLAQFEQEALAHLASAVR